MMSSAIEGIELVDMPEISDEVRGKIKQSIYSLHQHGIFGRSHKVTLSCKAMRIRIIRLSEKTFRQRKAKGSRIDLERHYGIKIM